MNNIKTLLILAAAPYLTLAIFPLPGNTSTYRPKGSQNGDLGYKLEVCCEEVMALKQRLKNQDTAIEAIQDAIDRSLNNQKKGKSDVFENRFLALKKSCDLISQETKETKTRLTEMEKKMLAFEKGMSDIKASIKEVLIALAIETKETLPVTYSVKPGDNLDRIAKKFKTKVRALKEINTLESDHLAIGQKLKIPEN